MSLGEEIKEVPKAFTAHSSTGSTFLIRIALSAIPCADREVRFYILSLLFSS
jgi:hypothetical protein